MLFKIWVVFILIVGLSCSHDPLSRADICGNGVIQGDEECDTGVDNNDSGECTLACKWARCGDGLVHTGVEGCDEGELNSNTTPDSCRLGCVLPHCGDQVRDTDEDCDDGNDVNTDGCPTSCQIGVCGDGLVEGAEECDDGNEHSSDGCLSSCLLARCGDHFIYVGVEECDQGSANSDHLADACREDCRQSHCGDGVNDSLEECDQGQANSASESDTCRLDCRLPSCGDGVVDTGESCDDGASNSNSAANACRLDCSSARCGDDVVDAGEDCDEGTENGAAQSSCSSACVSGPSGDGVADWISHAVGPPVAYGAAVYDSENRRVLLYGGESYYDLVSEPLGFSIDSGEWAAYSPTGAVPDARRGHGAVYDPVTGSMVIFGGETFYNLSNEVVVLEAVDPGSEHWSSLQSLGGAPAPRTGSSVVYQESTRRMLVVGGQGYYGLLMDAWSLDLAVTTEAVWTELHPSGAPGDGIAFSASGLDPINQTMLLVGGERYYGLSATALCLNLTTMEWQEAALSGDSIPPVMGASMVWASAESGFVLYGGVGFYTLYADSWLIKPSSPCTFSVTRLGEGSVPGPGPLFGTTISYAEPSSSAFIVGGHSYYGVSDGISELTP